MYFVDNSMNLTSGLNFMIYMCPKLSIPSSWCYIWLARIHTAMLSIERKQVISRQILNRTTTIKLRRPKKCLRDRFDLVVMEIACEEEGLDMHYDSTSRDRGINKPWSGAKSVKIQNTWGLAPGNRMPGCSKLLAVNCNRLWVRINESLPAGLLDHRCPWYWTVNQFWRTVHT